MAYKPIPTTKKEMVHAIEKLSAPSRFQYGTPSWISELDQQIGKLRSLAEHLSEPMEEIINETEKPEID